MFEAKKHTQAPGNFNTLKAVGKYVPDIGGQGMLGKHCKVPCGRTVTHRLASVKTLPLRFNEYIVFEQDRIRIKFIVHCERGRPGLSVALAALRAVPLQQPISLTPALLRPVSLKRPITLGQSGTVSISSTIRSNSTGLMSSQRYNVPSPRRYNVPSTVINDSVGSGTTKHFGYTVLQCCLKLLSSDFSILILVFVIVASANLSASFQSAKQF